MAVIGRNEENRGGCAFAGNEGKVSTETTDAETTCNSFWEAEGTGTGATGAKGTFDAAQHAESQQCRPTQQVFAGDEAPDEATIGYAVRRNPCSNTSAILVTLKVMSFSCPPRIGATRRPSHIGADK
jgi:hypothetical protein